MQAQILKAHNPGWGLPARRKEAKTRGRGAALHQTSGLQTRCKTGGQGLQCAAVGEERRENERDVRRRAANEAPPGRKEGDRVGAFRNVPEIHDGVTPFPSHQPADEGNPRLGCSSQTLRRR